MTNTYIEITASILSSMAGNRIRLINYRGGSRTAATSKMERFVIIVNGWKPLTIITKRSILDVATVLDPPLTYVVFFYGK